MTQSIQRLIFEDFDSLRGLVDHKTVSGGVETINLMNPYALSADFGIDHDAIVNWYDLNTNVTSLYASHHATDTDIRLGVSRDMMFNADDGETNRAPLSRHYWTGSITTDTTANTACFTHSDFGDGKTSDGFLHMLEPTHNHTGSYTRFQEDEMNQASLSVELQFDDLPAFTWVPLIGCTNRRKYRGERYTNNTSITVQYPDQQMIWNNEQNIFTYWGSTDNYTRSFYYPNAGNQEVVDGSMMLGWAIPGGISNSINNHYGQNWTTNNNPQWSFNTFYLIYCHDGNGNGMIATCPGMIGKDELSTMDKTLAMPDGLMASNAAHGVSGHDGMIRWTAPTTLTNWLTADADAGGATNTRLQRLWAAHSGSNSTRNRNMWQVGLDEDDAGLETLRSSDPLHRLNIFTDGNMYTDSNSNKMKNIINMKRNILMDGLLVAYGSMGDNADLSSPTTLYINRTGAVNYTNYNYYDSSGKANPTGWNARPNVSLQQFFTGKIGSLNFVNVPGWINVATEYQTNTSNDEMRLSQTPGWVLQPTVVGKGRINRFAIASYDSVNKGTGSGFGSNLAAYNEDMNAYYVVPHADEEFIYPKLDGQRTGYDPLRGASDDTSRFEYTNGSWNSVTSLTDDDTSTSVSCLSSGEANALYIKMTTPANDSGITASSTINSFTVQIQGITIPAVSNNNIRFAVTDSSKTTLLSSNDQQSINFGGLTTGTGNKFPTAGSFIVSMTPDSSTTVAYSAVSAGYMKLWLE